MALTKDIKRPDDTVLLEMVREGMAPSEIAKTIPYSANTVRGWLRDLGCTHDGKGRWFLTGAAPRPPQKHTPSAPPRPPASGRSVLKEQFPFIKTRRIETVSGETITMPHITFRVVEGKAGKHASEAERC